MAEGKGGGGCMCTQRAESCERREVGGVHERKGPRIDLVDNSCNS